MMAPDYYSPTTEDREAVDLLALRDDLTEWEEDFLDSLDNHDIWTMQQHEKLDVLFERKMSGGGKVR